MSNFLSIPKVMPIQLPVLFGSNPGFYKGLILGTTPLAYWPLDEVSGAIIHDLSGNSYDGTYTGVTLSDRRAPGGGGCPLFDGINDKGEILGTQLTAIMAALNRSEFTFAAWARVLNSSVWSDSNYRQVFGFYVNVNNRAYFIKHNVANTFQFIYNGNSATTKLHSWTPFSYSDWMFCVHTVSVSGDAMRSYINNTEFSPAAIGITAWTGTGGLRIGVNSSSGLDSWWKGWIAHATIWNRALTATEISGLYNGGLR